MINILQMTLYPDKAMHDISKKGKNINGIIVIFFSSVSATLAFFLIGNAVGQSARMFLMPVLLLKFVGAIFFCYLISVLYDFFAGLYGYVRIEKKIFGLVGCSMLPFVFCAPVAMITKMFFLKTASVAFILAAMFLLYWSLNLQYKAITYYYGANKANAVSILFMPWMVFVAFTGAVFIIVVFGVISVLL
ncbi:YIP1 family protein [Elusimicrobiota bacterium]